MIIISVGPGRSGTKWYYDMIRDMLTVVGVPDNDTLIDRFNLHHVVNNQRLHLTLLDAKRLLRLLPIHLTGNTVIVKTHKFPTRTSHLLSQLGIVRSLYIYRDPRDRMVSALKLSQKNKEAGRTDTVFSQMNGLEDVLQRFYINQKGHRDAWANHPNTLIWRYEDAIFNPLDMMLAARDFLFIEVEDSVISEIVDKHRLPGDPSQQIGRYKEYFSKEQIARIHDTIGDEIVHLGYALD